MEHRLSLGQLSVLRQLHVQIVTVIKIIAIFLLFLVVSSEFKFGGHKKYTSHLHIRSNIFVVAENTICHVSISKIFNFTVE